MGTDLTNLLPPERRRALSRDYLLRVAAVALALLTLLALVASLLLVPTYVFVQANMSAKNARLANIEHSLVSGDEATLSGRLAALSANTTKITALSRLTTVSTVFRAVLAVPHAGVTLSGFSYTAASGAQLPALIVSGSAATRDALRNYQLALQGASFVRSATLPVSAYASDSDITFAITVALAP